MSKIVYNIDMEKKDKTKKELEHDKKTRKGYTAICDWRDKNLMTEYTKWQYKQKVDYKISGAKYLTELEKHMIMDEMKEKFSRFLSGGDRWCISWEQESFEWVSKRFFEAIIHGDYNGKTREERISLARKDEDFQVNERWFEADEDNKYYDEE